MCVWYVRWEKNDLVILFFHVLFRSSGQFSGWWFIFDGTTRRGRWFNFLEMETHNKTRRGWGRKKNRILRPSCQILFHICPFSRFHSQFSHLRQHTPNTFPHFLPSSLLWCAFLASPHSLSLKCLKILLYKFHLIWFPHTGQSHNI